MDDPACDLAVAMAIASSYMDRSVSADSLLVGEVGLTGELRQVNQIERRLQEASQLGFKRAIIPHQKKKIQFAGMQLIECSFIGEAIEKIWKE